MKLYTFHGDSYGQVFQVVSDSEETARQIMKAHLDLDGKEHVWGGVRVGMYDVSFTPENFLDICQVSVTESNIVIEHEIC